MEYQVLDVVKTPWYQTWLSLMRYRINDYNRPIIERMDQENNRFVLIYGGERSGKSYSTVAILGRKLTPEQYPTKRTYWIVGPDYNQTRAEFEYLHQMYSALGLVVKASMPESPTARWSMQLSTNERWETRSSADIAKLASFSIHGALIVEANQQAPAVWLKIRGRLMEKRGWCVISGTYENASEWFVDLFYKWLKNNLDGAAAYSLPTWANSEAFPLGLDEPELQSVKATMPEEWFNERYAGIPSKPSNLVIPEFDWAIHVPEERMLVDPSVPVELAIDPGKKCYCVAFVQRIGRDRVHVLDCIYKRNWIAQSVIPVAMAHPLWPYVINGPAPHGAIDVAGFAEPGTISQADIWRKMAKVHLVGQRYPEDVTIGTLRDALARRMIYFNNMGNESLNGEAIEPLAEFRLWRWRDEVATMSEASKPIDRNNHFTKAIMYWWMWRIGAVLPSGDRIRFKRGGAQRWGNGIRTNGNQGRDQRDRRSQSPVQARRAEMGKRLRASLLERSGSSSRKSWRSS